MEMVSLTDILFSFDDPEIQLDLKDTESTSKKIRVGFTDSNSIYNLTLVGSYGN